MKIPFLSLSLLAFRLSLLDKFVQGIVDEDCLGFSVAKCDPPSEVILDVKHLPCDNIELDACADICQKICAITAACTFFKYDSQSQDCTMMQYDAHSGYLSRCALFSGPGEPDFHDCDEVIGPESCARFTKEDCSYSGAVVFSDTDVISAEDCQYLLFSVGHFFGGELFVHDALQLNLCEFRASKDKTCTAVNGPVHPPYLDCVKPATTIPPTESTTYPAPPSTTTWSGYDAVHFTFISLNAVNNRRLPGVTITFQISGNQTALTTNVQGEAYLVISNVNFPFNLMFNGSKEDFSSYSGSTTVNNNALTASTTFSLSPNLTPEQNYRLVMNWGHDPRDLDLHAIQFRNNQQCETYFANKNGCKGLYLDVDNTQGGDKGAETITWQKEFTTTSAAASSTDWWTTTTTPHTSSTDWTATSSSTPPKTAQETSTKYALEESSPPPTISHAQDTTAAPTPTTGAATTTAAPTTAAPTADQTTTAPLTTGAATTGAITTTSPSYTTYLLFVHHFAGSGTLVNSQVN